MDNMPRVIGQINADQKFTCLVLAPPDQYVNKTLAYTRILSGIQMYSTLLAGSGFIVHMICLNSWLWKSRRHYDLSGSMQGEAETVILPL